MKNDLFIQLLKLYRNSSEKTPTEDFTTELLAGVLQSDGSLLDQFVNEVLCVLGNDFTVKTQQKYDNSIIDMVFENHESICFVENKVESSEGYGQLSKYANILSQLDNEQEVFLRYCTKYYDKKNASDIEPLPLEKFNQFRWTDVFNFCEHYQDNLLVKPFFISSDRQDQEITDWFIQHMERFRKFKEATPELEW